MTQYCYSLDTDTILLFPREWHNTVIPQRMAQYCYSPENDTILLFPRHRHNTVIPQTVYGGHKYWPRTLAVAGPIKVWWGIPPLPHTDQTLQHHKYKNTKYKKCLFKVIWVNIKKLAKSYCMTRDMNNIYNIREKGKVLYNKKHLHSNSVFISNNYMVLPITYARILGLCVEEIGVIL